VSHFLRKIRKIMSEPWVNPRSRFFWFRRRVPEEFSRLGLPREIKFSLETTDREEAQLRCAQINLDLERQWRQRLSRDLKWLNAPLNELSHLKIVALAGEFYRETVAAHRENPGPAEAWEKKLRTFEETKHWRFQPPGA
jgi:uncharacterized protein DUF6538